MSIRVVQFIAIMLTALTFLPSGAHLLEYAGKMKLDPVSYMTVQQIYAGWNFLAIVILGAFASNIWLAFKSRGQSRPSRLALTSALLISFSLLTFFIWIFPANGATDQWTKMPLRLPPLRTQWERTHALNGVITLVALMATVASSLCWKDRPAR